VNENKPIGITYIARNIKFMDYLAVGIYFAGTSLKNTPSTS
jgi:hypothetical protein